MMKTLLISLLCNFSPRKKITVYIDLNLSSILLLKFSRNTKTKSKTTKAMEKNEV